MKNSNDAGQIIPSKAFISFSQVGMTNASFKWQPDASMLDSAPGHCGVYAILSSKNIFFAKVGIVRSASNLNVLFMHHAPNRVGLTEGIPLSKDESVHLELDIDPKTGNLVYWVNDKGMDMGILPGFKGGADKVSWLVAGRHTFDMLSGKLTDCAIATSTGWNHSVFHQDHVLQDNLHGNHTVEVLTRNSIAIGNRRSVA